MVDYLQSCQMCFEHLFMCFGCLSNHQLTNVVEIRVLNGRVGSAILWWILCGTPPSLCFKYMPGDRRSPIGRQSAAGQGPAAWGWRPGAGAWPAGGRMWGGLASGQLAGSAGGGRRCGQSGDWPSGVMSGPPAGSRHHWEGCPTPLKCISSSPQ